LETQNPDPSRPADTIQIIIFFAMLWEVLGGMVALIGVMLVGGVWQVLNLPIPSALPTMSQFVNYAIKVFAIVIAVEALVFFGAFIYDSATRKDEEPYSGF